MSFFWKLGFKIPWFIEYSQNARILKMRAFPKCAHSQWRGVIYWRGKIRFRIFKKTSSQKSRSSFLKIDFQNSSKTRNHFSDNFSRNFSKNKFWDVFKIPTRKEKSCFKKTKILRGLYLVKKHLQDWKDALEGSIQKNTPKNITTSNMNVNFFKPKGQKLYPSQRILKHTHPAFYSQSSARSLMIKVDRLGVAGRQDADVA